ncbi:MAG: V-type ATP synthase subunit I [bacterium]
MFKPAKMAKIDLQIPQDYVAKTTSILADLKRLHIMNVRKMRVGELDLDAHVDGNLLRKYTEIEDRLKKIFRSLGINRDDQSHTRSHEEINPHHDIFEIDQEIQQLESESSSFIETIEAAEKAKEEKQNLLRQLEIFSKAGINMDRLRRCRFLYVAAGLIPVDNLGRLELSLSNIYHQIIPSIHYDKRRLAFIFGPRKDQEKIEKALKSAYFEKLDFPQQADSSEHKIKVLQGQIQELEMKKSIACTRLDKARKDLEARLQQVNRKVMQSIALLEIGKSFDKVGNTYHISGWVPQFVVPSLKKEVMGATNRQAKIAITVPSGKQQSKGELLKIPTCFQNPFLLKPFEKLVSQYGVPSYGEVEPTFFFALSFLLMFGVMFGDVGHGLTLFFVGLLAFKKSIKENIQEIGLIIMECGFMSTLFGFLYGSVFGFEHLIPALWFNPMENISYFMKVTVGFGTIIISFGLILNIINSIRNNDYKRGILGEFGIMGLIFYWGCIGLVLIYMITGKLLANFGCLFILLIFPLLMIFLKEPLYNLYSKIILKENRPVLPENLGIYLMESLIEVGDTVIGFLSNTVSFVRVSAFALAHAGLFLAVFALANTLQNLKGGMFWYWLIMLLGNIAIIVIEGVVVSIQTIRLEYYEFFSKFFKGGGEIYKPLKI